MLGTDYGTDPAVIGPLTLAPGQVVKAVQFPRFTYEPLRLVLENSYVDAYLWMCGYEFGTDGPKNMFTTLPGGFAESQGPGGNELAYIDEKSPVPVHRRRGLEEGECGPGHEFHIPTRDRFQCVRRGGAAVAGAGIRRNRRQSPPLLCPCAIRTAEGVRVSLEVLEVQGRRVRVLVSGPQPAGARALDWDGRGTQGRPMANGIYFASFSRDDYRRVTKVSLLR